MSVPIPDASLVRLRASYAQFEQLAQVVMEAMGVDPSTVQSFDLKRGVLVPFDELPDGGHRPTLAAELKGAE